MAAIEAKCRFCNRSDDVKKHGKYNMHQRYRCQQCRKTFQLDYLYRACHLGIKEQIVNLAMNNAGIRDTARVYKHQCCCMCFKKLSPRCVTTLQLNNLKVCLICEVDEMWSFVRGKKRQRWLWYDWEPRLKRIVAHAFGDRTTETLNILLKRMENFKIAFCCTDKFAAYNVLPHKKHIVGKIYTQKESNTTK